MSSVPHMPLFCGDYLADTFDLTTEQHGAYLLILMQTWRRNAKAFPDDDTVLARACRCTPGRFRKAIRPVLEPFFDLSGGTWRSARLEKEWAYVAERAAISRANGLNGGRPKKAANGFESRAENCEQTDSVQADNPLKFQETENPAGSSQVTQDETTQTHTYKEEEDSVLRTAAAAACGVVPIPIPVAPKQQLFNPALLAAMAGKTGKTVDDIRKLFGRAQSLIGAGQALEVAVEALGATVPMTFFNAAVATRNGSRKQQGKPMEPGAERFLRRMKEAQAKSEAGDEFRFSNTN